MTRDNLKKTLNELYYPIQPSTSEAATVSVIVYHPETMERPYNRVISLTSEELQASNDHKLVETVTESALHSILGEWRGPDP